MAVNLRSLIPVFCTLLGITLIAATLRIAIADEKAPTTGPEPVDNMHHFMEYVFEPNYKRLKADLAEAPPDKQTWKAIKGSSLTLAEGGNLLLMRVPEEGGAQWQSLSIAVRGEGAKLFQAARKQDYAGARGHYLSMLKNCNACHQHFADGEYQLEP